MLKTNIEALRGLYVALGGDVADVAVITTLPEMLEKISTVAAAAAGELPAVTSSDNGDVLTVVSGKWAKAAPASGGVEDFVVSFSGNNGSTCNKTYAQIKEAFEAGKRCIADLSNVTGDSVELQENQKVLLSSISDYFITFASHYHLGDNYYNVTAEIQSNNLSYVDTSN